MAFDGHVPARLALDGSAVPSETVYAWAGPYSLTLVTSLPTGDAPIQMQSTYVGHPGARTVATHLLLGTDEPQVVVRELEDRELCLVFTPRLCVYDHADRVLRFLRELGREATLDLADDAFAELEAVSH